MANYNCNSCFLNGAIMDAFSNMRLSKELNNNAPEETAKATVLSRRISKAHITRRVSSAWLHLVTFRLDRGEERELRVEEAQFSCFPEGAEMTITWQEETLVSFSE